MENVNDIFLQFSECLCGTVQDEAEIVHPSQLKRDQLDYTLPSLKSVDEYLGYLHRCRAEPLDRDWTRTVLRCGAYVGEVIRRTSRRRYDWVDFDVFREEYPGTSDLLGIERQLGIAALLTPGNGAFTLPINKVLRFICDGPADSVWFYAHCETKE